jgi:hypothetical protein
MCSRNQPSIQKAYQINPISILAGILAALATLVPAHSAHAETTKTKQFNESWSSYVSVDEITDAKSTTFCGSDNTGSICFKATAGMVMNVDRKIPESEDGRLTVDMRFKNVNGVDVVRSYTGTDANDLSHVYLTDLQAHDFKSFLKSADGVVVRYASVGDSGYAVIRIANKVPAAAVADVIAK